MRLNLHDGRTDNCYAMRSSTAVTADSRVAVAPPSAAFDALARALSSVDFRGTDAVSIQALLAATAIDEAALAPFVSFTPGRYTRNGVFRSAAFELVVICWPAHTRSAVHGHGGSRGFVKMVRGTLVAENFTLLANGREPGHAGLEFAGTRILNPGDIEIVSPGQDVHRVGTTAESAISLHVYAQPLERYLTYDVARQSCSVAVSRYDMLPRSPAH